MAKILVVDDDEELSTIVQDWLTHESHAVDSVLSGVDAKNFLATYTYDVIVLDWGLPDISGLEILRQFRSAGGNTPVLILTGKKELDEKETGLDAGADDYLTKPFEMRELSARLRALLRRPAGVQDTKLTIGDIVLDPSTHSVTKSGVPLKMFRKEFALLEFLLRHPQEIFSPEALLDRVWRAEAGIGPEAVRTTVKRLREFIDDPGQPSLIENVRGVGYRIKHPSA